MARSIDERIVQMTFNNQDFERKAAATIKTLGALKTAADFTGLNKGFQDLGKTANSLNFNPLMDSVQAVGKQFNAWEELAIGALRKIGDQAVQTGERLIKSLTIDLVSTGWTKYDDLNGSVQTLVNSTGKSVDEIDKYLKRLMWYSDETSFGFTDMTKALGTMVSSGGDVEKLIPMLMGIGNAVAFAGKGAAEFQRAIYNLNQSYSQGALNTLDWKSLSNASVDSKELKNQLLQAAVELNKITKSQAKLENFSDFLKNKTFDRNVMELAFGRFAEFTLQVEEAVRSGQYETASEAMEALSGSTAKFAEDAFIAGQSAKSFKEALDATKDAVSSGWMQTFQIIFGSYDEAKALWTDVVEDLWDIFASGAKKRNNILQEWKDIWLRVYDASDDIAMQDAGYAEMTQYATQTHAVIAAISDLILQIRDDLVSVWKAVFPIRKTLNEAGEEVEDYVSVARKIFFVIEDVRKAIVNLREEGLESDVGRAFRKGLQALLEVLKTVAAYAKTFVDSFIGPLRDMLMPVIQDIGAVFALIFGEVIRGAQDARKDLTPFQKVLEAILNILKPIVDFIGQIVKGIKEWLAEASVSKALNKDSEQLSLFSKVLNGIAKLLTFVANVFNGTVNVFKSLASVFGTVIDKIKGSIGNLLESHGTDVAGLAEGGFLGVLGVALASLVAKLKKLDLKTIIEAVKGAFTDSKDSFLGKIKGVLDSVSNALNTFTESIKIKMLKEIANTIVKLAAALLIISLVDSDKIASSLAAMMAVLGEAMVTMGVLGAMKPGNIQGMTRILSSVATSIILLSVALKILSGINPEQIGSSLLLLGGSLTIVAGFIWALNAATKRMRDVKIATIAAALKSIGFAMIEMAAALKIMSGIPFESMKIALLGLGGALTGVFAFIVGIAKLTKGNGLTSIQAAGKGLMFLGASLIEMALALKIMGTMNIQEMGIALLGLVAGLAAIFGFAVGVSKLAGANSFAILSVSMIAMGTGLLILAGALKVLGSMSLAQIGKGLLGMAGALVLMGATSVVLGVLSPLLLAASVAISAFGGALLLASKGLLAFAGTYTLISTIGRDISGSLLEILVQASAAIIQLVPGMLLGLGQAVINISGQLIKMIGQLILMLSIAIRENLPILLETWIFVLLTILTAIRDNIYEFSTLGGDILTGFLEGIRDKLGNLILVVFEILSVIIESLGQGIPMLIDAGQRMIIDFINGLAESIRNNAGDFGAAIGNLCSAIIEGIVTGFGSAVATFGGNLLGAGASLIDGIKNLFSGGTASEGAVESGSSLVTSLSTGIETNSGEAYSTAEDLGKTTAEKMEASEEATTSGKDTLNGLVIGLQDPELLEQIRQQGINAGNVFMEAYRSVADINSPSKEMEKLGLYTISGLVRGLSDLVDVNKAGQSVGQAVLDSISQATSIIDDTLENDLNPVITPVLDLSNISNGASAISGMLDTGASYNAALAVNGSRMRTSEIQNSGISSPTINVNFTVNQAGGEFDNDTIARYGRQIADEVNVTLGKLLWR